MPITIDLPPAIVQEIKNYEQTTGQAIESLFVDFLHKELERIRKRAKWQEDFDKIVRESAKSLSGKEPYKFNRADAYEETMA